MDRKATGMKDTDFPLFREELFEPKDPEQATTLRCQKLALAKGKIEAVRNIKDISLAGLIRFPPVRNLIRNANIFILGKVGFYTPILELLRTLFPANPKIVTIRTESQLEELSQSDAADRDRLETLQPFILLPAATNQVGLNQLITRALGSIRKTWVVALPSQVQQHLLLSFNCYFLSPTPIRELTKLQDITPVTAADVCILSDPRNIMAVFSADQTIPNIGEPDRAGTVTYLNRLED